MPDIVTNIYNEVDNISIEILQKIQNIIEDIIKKELLTPENLYIGKTRASDSTKNNSNTVYYICSAEAPYPCKKDELRSNYIEKTAFSFDYKRNKKIYNIFVPSNTYNFSVPEEKISTGYKYSYDDNNTDTFYKDIYEAIIQYLKNYKSSAASFGCCSRHVDCSDAKQCVHPNQLYSHSCMYRRSLDDGKIFYGKNKNTED